MNPYWMAIPLDPPAEAPFLLLHPIQPKTRPSPILTVGGKCKMTHKRNAGVYHQPPLYRRVLLRGDWT